MELPKVPTLSILCCFSVILGFTTKCANSDIMFLKAPHAFSHLNYATFVFQVLENKTSCTECSFNCRLDDGFSTDCTAGKAFYSGLLDANHTFHVCSNGSLGSDCSSYNWTVDTVPPTASVTAGASFTNASNVSVVISFSEPCTEGGKFGCSSVNACNLLVYGAGHVIPSTFSILERDLTYSLTVAISSTVQYGRAILVMDRNFCADRAGNAFTRTANSTFYVHFDRRSVFVNLRTHVPERLLELDRKTRTVQATNNPDNLKVYLYFTAPVQNSSAEIMRSFSVSQGSLLPISGMTNRNRKFGFSITNLSETAIVTVVLKSNLIISRQWTPVTSTSPVTFLYDTTRPAVKLSTYSMRTRENMVQILVKFTEPVFGFNSNNVFISGGLPNSFHEIGGRTYIIEIQAGDDVVSVSIPENATVDIAGNKNLASNVLHVRHYSVSMLSTLVSAFVTASFVLTSLVAGLLNVATTSLQSVGAFFRPYPSAVDPGRNLFRIACYIQIFALSRWLSVTLPTDYHEFSRNLRWSIPYFSLPWENTDTHPALVGSNPFGSSNPYVMENLEQAVGRSMPFRKGKFNMGTPVYGLPLSPTEYKQYFENENILPEAEYILDSQHSSGWRVFDRNMFWLAVFTGSLILLHVFLIFIIKFKKKNSEKQKGYGALTFPRFEIFLAILALPTLSMASAVVFRGGAPEGTAVGVLLLYAVLFLVAVLFLFLSVGITFGKLLQYKEVHQEGQIFHWYQEIIRVTLGPGKRGQWTWKDPAHSGFLIIFGPLFEDLRGPPKYMLSQIAGGHAPSQGDSIIASEDENEDAEAPFIQKVFGILRIYYTLLEWVRRVVLGILAGVYMDSWSSNKPTIVMVCLTFFQLFFVVLKKPFIKKKVQLVEIISLSTQVVTFATFLVLLKLKVSISNENKIGTFMLIMFLTGYLAQIFNEWNALYKQIRMTDSANKSFWSGLKISAVGVLLFFIPLKLLKSKLPANPAEVRENGETTSSAERNRSSGSRSSGDKPLMRQLRELAKASFSREGGRGSGDPSSSRPRWSELLGGKRSGSSSLGSSSNVKSNTRGLYKDLEAIFASK